jgi:hypothetical protein
VANENFTIAVKVFGSSRVTTYNEDTMRILGDKHSYRPPPFMLTTIFFGAPLMVVLTLF